jgi:CRISPR-associated endonuclease/helicase Cas3
MSLDLDADLLVSELAPIPALIQRLGRLNRRVTEAEPGEPRDALFFPPEDPPPYEKDQLDAAELWLDDLTTRYAVSQRDLADRFRHLADTGPQSLDIRTEWLDSGWLAMPGQVRDAGFSVSVILAKDADACRQSREEIIKRSLSLPYRTCMAGWQSLRGCLIAPPDVIEDDKHKGATWAN